MGEHTALYERCCAFVEEQSCGEWDDKTIREDATKLHAFIVSDRAVADLVKAVERVVQVSESGANTISFLVDLRKVAVECANALSRFRELEKANG